MVEELEALKKNKTWELIDLPKGKNTIGCKWIYSVKQNAEGKVERYKARLVARDIVRLMALTMMRRLHKWQK
jgi:hypothetical protein